MSLETVTAEWMMQLSKVQGLVLMSRMGANILDANYIKAVSELFDATRGGLMFTDAAFGAAALEIGLPVVVMVGVWVALGSGYYQARQEAKSENAASGFAQGFVTAILDWNWDQVRVRFRRPLLNINHFDEEMNVIRVRSYHEALVKGYLAGRALPPAGRKAYSAKIRTVGNVHGPHGWSEDEDTARNQQISYVIEMASAARRFNIIKQQ
jgi:hypothetical protein